MAVKNVFMDIFFQVKMIQRLKIVKYVIKSVKHVNIKQVIVLNVNILC